MKKLMMLMILLVGPFTFAENTEILKCRVSNPEWRSTIVIDSLGAGILRFQKTGDTNFYACALRMVTFNDTRGGQVAVLKSELRLGACDPDISQYRNKILPSVNILIDLTSGAPKTGSLQWLQDKQPDECQIEKLRSDDTKEYSSMFRKGSWGRRPASAPEKFKKKF